MTDENGDDTKDAVKDKFAQRFEAETDESTEQDAESDTAEDAEEPRSDETESTGTSTPISIRDRWPNHSFYLSDELSDSLGSQFKKLDWQLSDEYGLDIKKTRHYYPLIAKLGLEQLQELDNDEIKDRVEEIEPEDDYFD